MIAYLYMSLMLVSTAVGQFLIKKGTLLDNEFAFIGIGFNKSIIFGAIVTLIAPIFYFLALQYFDLSVAYAISTVNYILLLIVGVVFFDEGISRDKILGTVIVMLGVILFNL